MRSKWPAALAVLGGVWMLFLFFNAADVTYQGHESSDLIRVRCEPLGHLTGSVQDLDSPLTSDQDVIVSKYLDKSREEHVSGDEQQRIQATARQSILADCHRAREDRVALLILVAVATTLLTITQLHRRSSLIDVGHGVTVADGVVADRSLGR